MGKYIVTSGQNIYDVALHLHGSIEGVIDLLMNNTSLSLAETLESGDELIYTDNYVINPGIVAYNRLHNIVPANGERNVYYKAPPESCNKIAIEVLLPGTATFASLTIAGQTPVYIDWGDNSVIQEIALATAPCYHHHSFDNLISHRRKIRVYSRGDITEADFSGLNASALYLLGHNAMERFTLTGATMNLDFIPAQEEVYYLDLTGIKTRSLLPLLENKKLMTLNLTDARVSREAIDEYLIGLVKKHRGRRNCEVILTTEPSGEFQEPGRDGDLNYILTSGMEAIWVIVNEPAWNEGGSWKFNINSMLYTFQP